MGNENLKYIEWRKKTMNQSVTMEDAFEAGRKVTFETTCSCEKPTPMPVKRCFNCFLVMPVSNPSEVRS